MGVLKTRDLAVPEPLLRVRAGVAEARDAVDDVDGQAEAVDLVLDRELERRADAPLLLVPPYVRFSWFRRRYASRWTSQG